MICPIFSHSVLILFFVCQSLSIDISFKTKFHFERAAGPCMQSPVLKLKTDFNVSNGLSGSEYGTWARLMKEVFDEDIAMPYGQDKFLWDSIDIAGK